MPPSVKISAEFVGLTSSLEKQVRAAMKGGALQIPINDKAFNSALSGMTGNLRRFEQSLDFSNRRVIAFGTSASIVYGTVRAFNELVKATIDVEKRMVSINSILGQSGRGLDAFSKSLFDVARQTGQAFDEVSKAAEELARQGLGAQETLKRTRDAMILTRLTGLDAAKSVETLTAAINTYGRAGEDTTSIINKLVAVDQRFAVSSKDLAEAFQRVGSTAQDAGVSIEEFTGLVTAAKQITSREGAVIGNSLKTIFTRLERSSTLDQLEAMGVAIRDAAGNAKPAMQVFQAVADAYKNMTREQQQRTAELGAGVFQINQFKALLSDLGRADGIKEQATRVAANATNEALIRNAALNDTLATSIQNLKTSATQAASVVGGLGLKPLLMRGLEGGNFVADLFKNMKATGDTKPGEDFGAYIGESILKGIGNVLAGPGLILMVRGAMGLLRRTLPEVMGDLRSSINMSSPNVRGNMFSRMLQPTGEAEAIARTNQLLAKGTEEEQRRFMAARTVAEQEAAILAILQRQAVVAAELAGIKRATIAQIAAEESKLAGGAPAITSLRRVRSIPRGAGGYIPMGEEASAIARGIGGAPSHARPVYLPHFARGDGLGIVANSSEWIAPTPKGPAVFNREMISRHGLPPGSTPVAAGGYIPNAAFGSFMGQPGGQGYNLAPLSSRYGPSASGPIVPGGVTPGAMGQGFGQYTDPQATASREITLRKQAENAAYEARILAQREAAIKADVEAWNTERARIAAITAAIKPALNIVTDITRRASPEQMAAYEAQRAAGAAGWVRPDNALAAPGMRDRQRATRDRAALDSVIAARAAQRAQLGDDLTVRNRLERRMAAASRVQNGFLLGSLASGFIPQGQGGTGTGQALGAASGAVQGGAFGAFLGSMGGPMGTFIGAGVGALGGALMGFLGRAQKSMAEVAEEVNKETAKLKEQMDATVQAFDDLDAFNEGKASGLKASSLLRLQQRSQASLARVSDPDVKAMILSGNRGRATEIQSDRADVAVSAGAFRTATAAAVEKRGNFLSLFNPFESADKFSQRVIFGDNEAVTGGRDAYRAQLSRMSDADLLDLSKRIPTEGFATPDMMRKAMSREIADRAMMKRLEQARVARAGPNPMLRPEALALGSRIQTEGEIEQIGAEATMRALRVRQQIDLDAPLLTDVGRLRRGGQFERENIGFEAQVRREALLAQGKGSLIQELGSAGVKDRAFIERLEKAGAGDLGAILGTVKQSDVFGSAKNPDEVRKQTTLALQDLIKRLEILNVTEQRAIEVSDETNRMMVEDLRFRKTPQGASAYLRGALRQNVDDSRIANQAVIDVARGPEGKALVPGAMLSDAMFGQANAIGQAGMSKGSFMGGFKSVMAGAQHDLKNFAEVGRNVSSSLAANFADAFGNFVTGASKAKDAFRDFILGVLRDAARAFATKAVVSLLGMFFGNIGTGSAGTGASGFGYEFGGQAKGGPIGRAAGGSIPTLLTGGEYVYSPAQAARLGSRNLHAINSGTARFAPGGLVRGGSGVRDDVFASLSPGSYVIRKPMVERYGAGALASLSIGGAPEDALPMPTASLRLDDGGPVSSMMATPTPISAISGGGNTAVSIGVTINDNSTSSTSSKTEGGSPMDRRFAESLAARMKQVALQTIAEQQRVGGILR